jgi:Leucine-rich repeat (LRR) protein
MSRSDNIISFNVNEHRLNTNDDEQNVELNLQSIDDCVTIDCANITTLNIIGGMFVLINTEKLHSLTVKYSGVNFDLFPPMPLLHYLTLHDDYLMDIPQFVFESPELEYLVLTDNRFTPKSLLKITKKMDNLRHLDLSINPARHFAPILNACKNLEYLNISWTGAQIDRDILSALQNLSKLTTLLCVRVGLDEYPIEFCNMLSLKTLDISKNRMKELPKEMMNVPLENLTMHQLSLKDDDIPAFFLSWKSLKMLDITATNIKFTENICNMTQLESLKISCNDITYIPERVLNLTSLRAIELKMKFADDDDFFVDQKSLVNLPPQAKLNENPPYWFSQ